MSELYTDLKLNNTSKLKIKEFKLLLAEHSKLLIVRSKNLKYKTKKHIK